MPIISLVGNTEETEAVVYLLPAIVLFFTVRSLLFFEAADLPFGFHEVRIRWCGRSQTAWDQLISGTLSFASPPLQQKIMGPKIYVEFVASKCT